MLEALLLVGVPVSVLNAAEYDAWNSLYLNSNNGAREFIDLFIVIMLTYSVCDAHNAAVETALLFSLEVEDDTVVKSSSP